MTIYKSKRVICFLLTFIVSFYTITSIEEQEAHAIVPLIALAAVTAEGISDVALAETVVGLVSAGGIAYNWDYIKASTIALKTKLSAGCLSALESAKTTGKLAGQYLTEVQAGLSSLSTTLTTPYNLNVPTSKTSITETPTSEQYTSITLGTDTLSWILYYQDSRTSSSYPDKYALTLNGTIVNVGDSFTLNGHTTQMTSSSITNGNPYYVSSKGVPQFYLRETTSEIELTAYVYTYAKYSSKPVYFSNLTIDEALSLNTTTATATSDYKVATATFDSATEYNFPTQYATSETLTQAQAETFSLTDTGIVSATTTTTPTTDTDTTTGLLGSVIDSLANILEYVESIPTTILSGVRSIVTGVTDVLAETFGYVQTIPDLILNGLKELLVYLFVPSTTYLTDNFTELKAILVQKFPLDLSLLETLNTSADDFKSITINTSKFAGVTSGEDVVILSAESVNKYITTIRLATSCFFIIMLIVFIINQISKIFQNSNIVDGGA